MARVLYTSWFSTFARKAALGLELKGLDYEPVDTLTRDFKAQLLRVNPRAEVPVLLDDDLVIVNSSDILQYLDWRYPAYPLYPESIAERVVARALERLADHRFDPLIVDCSYWAWAERDDERPHEFMVAGQADLENALAQLETVLAARPKPWPFGRPGLIECAWFPNLIAARPLGFVIDQEKFPAVLEWLTAMREHPLFAADAKRTKAFLKTLSTTDHELRRIFYSGDRLEWLFSRGFHDWFANEITQDRVSFPP